MPEHRGPVFLVGFMGAGKTEVGRALARRLAWDFVDLDALVIAAEGRSIGGIFAESGEAGFRQAELRALETLRGRRRVVVACGGGTYAQREGRARIDEMGSAVWIDVPLAAALARCRAGPDRPLLGDERRVEALFRARLPAYGAAPFRVEAADLTPEMIAERIAGLLGTGG